MDDEFFEEFLCCIADVRQKMDKSVEYLAALCELEETVKKVQRIGDELMANGS